MTWVRQIGHDFRTFPRRSLLWPGGVMARGLNRNLAMVLLLMVFCGEAAIGLLMFRDLSRSNSEMRRMYERSVRGLHQIGETQYDAQKTRRSTPYASHNQRRQSAGGYADMSRVADHRVDKGIAEYLSQEAT